MKNTTRWAIVLCNLLFLAVLAAGPVWAHTSEKIVLFDQSHGQRFLIESEEPLGLSRLAGALLAEGLTSKPLRGGISSAALQGVDALIVAGPFQAFSQVEIDAVTAFLNRGGRLCLMLHIAYPVIPLLEQFGVVISRAPVRDQVNIIAGNPLDFKVTTLVDHPLTAGLAAFNVYGGWGLLNLDDRSKVLASTSPKGWSDMNGDGVQGEDEPDTVLGVMVVGEIGKGEFVVVGDDAVFQNKFLNDGNLKLAENIAAWLQGADN